MNKTRPLNEIERTSRSIGANVGILEFKGRYKYVPREKQDACNAALADCIDARYGASRSSACSYRLYGSYWSASRTRHVPSLGTLDKV